MARNSSNSDQDGDGGGGMSGALQRGIATAQVILEKVFRSCEGDGKGAVHRLWGVNLILVIIYFVVSVIEMINIQAYGGSRALVIAAVWTGMMHVALAVMGTFVLKRFPTSFSIGFLLGVVLILANQNLIVYATFRGYPMGTRRATHAYSALAFLLFFLLGLFGLLLTHFKDEVAVAAVDIKGLQETRSNTTDGEEDEEA